MIFLDKKRWSRRAVLSRFAAGAALSPFLPLLNSVSAAQSAGPVKRFVQWFYPLGTRPEYYFPKGGETDFQLGEVLSPFANGLREDLVILKGMYHSGGMNEPHDPMPAFTCSFTENDLVGYGPAHGDPDVAANNGTSIDQYLASRMKGSTAYPILLFDICNNGGGNPVYHANSKLNHKGVPGEGSPYAAFDRLFAGLVPAASGGAPDPALERIRSEKRSVLDLVMAELTTLETQVIAAHDKDQLQHHLDGLRSMEMRLQNPTIAVGEGCAPPVVDKNNQIDKLSYVNMAVLGKLQMDIAVASLACDMTRVVNIQWSRPGSDEPVPPVISDNYHGLTHNPADDTGMIGAIRDASKLFNTHLAYFAQQLKSRADGIGTMLDTTTILSNSEVGEPNGHTHHDVPYLLVGGSAGYKTGRYLQYSKPTYGNRLMVAVCHALGYTDVQRYGDTDKIADFPPDLKGLDRGTGPLERLL